MIQRIDSRIYVPNFEDRGGDAAVVFEELATRFATRVEERRYDFVVWSRVFAAIRRAEIRIEGASHSCRRVERVECDGNETRILRQVINRAAYFQVEARK